MIIVVTEKVVAGQRIAAILAKGNVATKFSDRAPYLDFSASGKDYAVIPLKGHIVEVDFPKKYSYWLGTDLRQLAQSEIEYISSEKHITNFLKKHAALAEEAIVATDADREGESIGVEALNFIKEGNNKIKIKRAYFSAITPKDITDAFSNLREVDYNFADSADARREIDLVWGAVLTRFLSLISGQMGKDFLSVGRVQTPSVDYFEDLVIQDKNGLISIVKIGDFVEQFSNKPSEIVGNCSVFETATEGFRALSFNPNTLKLEFKPITNAIKHKHLGYLYEITLESGRKVKITGTHSIFILRDGKIEVVVGEELKNNDVVLAPKSFDENNTLSEINLLNEFLKLETGIKSKFFISSAFKRKWVRLTANGRVFLKNKRLENNLIVYKTRFAASTISQLENGKNKKVNFTLLSNYLSALDYHIDWFLSNGFGELVKPVRQVIKLSEITNFNEICLDSKSRLYSYNLAHSMPLSLNLSPEFMRLLGYYLSEGSCSDRNSSIDFGKHEKNLALDAVHCINAVFGSISKIHVKKSTIHLNFGGQFGKILFSEIFKAGIGAKNKKIPNLVFNVSRELKKEFLKAYFEGDGNYSLSGQLQSSTASPKLASDMLYLLNQFGVIGSIERRLNDSALPNQLVSIPRVIYKVRISGKKSLNELREIVPRRHKERLDQYLQSTTTKCGYDGIPIDETNISKIWTDLPRHYRHKISPSKLFSLVQNTNKTLSIQAIQKLSNLAQTDLAFLKIVQIEKVKPSTDFVYDVSVKDNENFVGGFGGIVLHNTLTIVVDREKERLAFKSVPYWEIKALFEKDSRTFEAEHKKGRFSKKEEAQTAFENSKKSSKGIVIKADKRKKSIEKPIPFNTTAFLREATTLGMSAAQAMSVAESLYLQGLISYPRTDNTVYPPTLNLKEILIELKKSHIFSPLAEKILKQKTIEPSRGKEATKDHPPIHPVSVGEKEKLNPQQWKIYELVVRRFLATLSEEAETENIVAEINLNNELFIARGQTILKLGWKEFYPYSKISETILPPLIPGDIVNLKKIDLLSKETQPPARYSQSTLLKLMEENNLGTKSTRAEIIQKLYARKYISGNQSIIPNKIAFAVIDSLEKHSEQVTKPKMTADLENEMDMIAAGKKGKLEVVADSRKFLLLVLEELLKNKDPIARELRSALLSDSIIGNCTNPECTGQLLIRQGKTGKRFLGCNAYPKCTVTYPLPQKGKLIVIDKKCEACGKPMFKLQGTRFSFEACIDMACKSKDEWKKRQAEKLAAKQEKHVQAEIKKEKTEKHSKI